MLIAEIHGKTGEEDELTGGAFGLMTILPSELLLVPWLRAARNLRGDTIALPDSLEDLEVEFWPNVPTKASRCEPDVVLTYKTGDDINALLVEVKYRSGPSGFPSPVSTMSKNDVAEVTGQLSKQWIAFGDFAEQMLPGAPERVRSRQMLFITADTRLPREILVGMLNEVCAHTANGSAFEAGCFWLDWSTLHGVAVRALQGARLLHRERRAIELLISFLRVRSLTSFNGLAPLKTRSHVAWSYGKGGAS